MNLSGFFTLSSHYDKTSSVELSEINNIGQKAYGLLKCPSYLTPPFFVINSLLYKQWLENHQEAEQILSSILTELNLKFSLSKGSFIVRSSAKDETLEERGYYSSSQGNIKWDKLFAAIKEVWTQNSSNFIDNTDNELALIIQVYIKSNLSGHLSNERRVSRSRTEWLIEIVSDSNNFLEEKKFSTKPVSRIYTKESFNAIKKRDVINALKLVAYKNVSDNLRVHLEWIWDGARVWIVQNDVEDLIEKGTKPGNEWERSNKIIEEKTLKSFDHFSDAKHNWKKVECVKTFANCGLPHGRIFILENASTLQALYQDEIPNQLLEDLEWLLTYPIVIRMDVRNTDAYNNILLPRTETITNLDEAISFLKTKTRHFIDQLELPAGDFCFLIHRFINAKACALAFSKPNVSKARIDATWGIVDGLYYHPHDSFEISLDSDNPKIKKLIRCKTEYLDSDLSGKWLSKKAGVKWDWAESLNKKQVQEIAEYNTKLANYLDQPITVMYFVDIDPSTGYHKILPWFYTDEEVTESSDRFTDPIFSVKRELIQSEDDFNNIKQRIETNTFNNKITLKLKLNPDILRDKDLIESIGEFAKEKNIPIEIEGSILSHAYYILRKKGAKVKCINPFEPTYSKQNFFKLVRDKIPVNIESKGEKVKVVKVDSNSLLKLIKQKAVEEAFEFYLENENDAIIEELADLYEVIRASCKIFGADIKEIENIANKKLEKKGGFESGIILVNTEESSLIDIVDNDGESLLINEKKLKSNSKAKKLPKKRITFGMDASITLPYFLLNNGRNTMQVKAPLELQTAEAIEIIYTNQGIKLKFLQPKQSDSDLQISLFSLEK